jgi:hypothetical protein
MQFFGSYDRTPKCDGCATGDPYLDPDWPCETRELADKGLADGD